MFVIFGCGYTGRRVAAALLQAGQPVIATTRQSERLDFSGAEVIEFEASDPPDLSFVPERARILYSIPALEPDPNAVVLTALAARRPERVVYLSTTGVYGNARWVDEHTPVAPRTAREHARVNTENAVLSGPWSGMVLRPAAIYGPGRGVHVKMLAGKFRLLDDGSNYVSRIHVEDLAGITVAALLGEIGGAWPVADDEPCRSRDIAAFCADLLHLPMPRSTHAADLPATPRTDRRVDGSGVRRLLGLKLRYPSYRQGVPASLASGPTQLL